MRYIIQLEDGRFVKRSVLGKGLNPVYSADPLDAEQWGNQEAAIAWCQECGKAASVIPIETIAEAKPAKPVVKKVAAKKATDM